MNIEEEDKSSGSDTETITIEENYSNTEPEQQNFSFWNSIVWCLVVWILFNNFGLTFLELIFAKLHDLERFRLNHNYVVKYL